MSQSIEYRTLIGVLLVTLVIVTGISVYCFLWSSPTQTVDARYKKSLVSEMQTMMDTVIADQRTIADLNRQFELTGSSRPSFASQEISTYPAFQPRKGKQPQWPAANLPFQNSEFPFHADLAAVRDRVSSVQSALASSELKMDTARNDVQILRRHLSDQAKMIRASNERLAEIAALDQRRYIYFDLSKGEPQAVDQLQLLLKKADPKHNRFTLALIADNHTVTEKNRGLKQPIEIYVQKYPRACEVVVSNISHDRVSGYVSIRER